MADIFDWSATDSANIAVDGTGINTGMSPANVDNALRKIMAAVRNSFASALETFFAGTAALPIANGGTSATSSSAALTALGALSTTYRDLPPVSKTTDFTVTDAERGGIYLISGSTGTITVNLQSTTAITSGAVYRITNIASGAYTISAPGVTINRNGNNPVSSIVIAAGASCTLIHVLGDFWTCDGSGIS
jgi:hypothetical protein